MANEWSRITRAIRESPRKAAALAAGLALAGTAAATRLSGDAAERRHPPRGRFVRVDGVNVHYLEAGSGPPVLLLHGNGAMAEDFVISGLFDRIAERHRVIAPDRPGFGYTERPRGRIWTPAAQAKLMQALLVRLGLENPVVVGHSWGTLVALSLALDTSARLHGLVLLSGYFYPTPRPDVVVFGAPAVPVVGDVMRYTVSPLLGRAIVPAIVRRIFEPCPVPPRFRAEFPIDLALRPWQIRASAEDTALMVPGAAALAERYRELDLPVVIIAGDQDRIVSTEAQSRRLHQAARGSRLTLVPGVGHMVHYAAGAEIARAIDLLS